MDVFRIAKALIMKRWELYSVNKMIDTSRVLTYWKDDYPMQNDCVLFSYHLIGLYLNEMWRVHFAFTKSILLPYCLFHIHTQSSIITTFAPVLIITGQFTLLPLRVKTFIISRLHTYTIRGASCLIIYVLFLTRSLLSCNWLTLIRSTDNYLLCRRA